MVQSGIRNEAFGNQIIGFLTKDEAKKISASQDVASLYEWFEDDPIKSHLGMIDAWNAQGEIKYPLIHELLKNKQVIEANGSFTFDTPVYKDTGMYVEVDTSNQLNAGIDGSYFKIALNKKLSKGDVITFDPDFGEDARVVDDEEILQKGTAFWHTVQLVSNDPMAVFPAEKLRKGIQFFKITHKMDEYGTSFSQFDFSDSMSYMRSEFTLGSFTGVEAWMTGKADKKAFAGGAINAQKFLDRLQKEALAYKGEYVVIADAMVKDGNGNLQLKNAKLGSILQWLVFRELEKLTIQGLLYSKGGTVKTSNGVVHINEGLIPQLRRGFRIQYGRPGGITKADIKKAVDYVYSINPYKANEERKVKFICGTGAYDNVMEIFKDELNPQLEKLSLLTGTQMLLPKSPITGTSLTGLGLDPVLFTNVYLAGIGKVEIVKDASLDYQPMVDRFSRGMHDNGKAHTTYTMLIWDVTNPEYSNNMDFPQNTKLVEGGDNGANIFLVKPYGNHIYFGRELGRYDSRIMSAQEIVNSRKEIGEGYWAWNQLDIWVKEPMRVVMIELDPKARKGFN